MLSRLPIREGPAMVHRVPSTPRRLVAALLATVLAVLSLALSAGPAPAAPTSDFVQRDGTRLTVGGMPFRFAGPNMYWLGLDENVGGIDPAAPAAVDYPTYFRIRDGLTTAKAMGATAVRAHTLGVSTGTPKALEPELGRYNAAAFAPIDYAIAEAGRQGLKLIIPLTDNWQYYHGSRFDYLRWLGLSTDDDGALFYTDPDARAAYQRFVKQLLQHRNPYTGLRYVDDPTIMAWELGNELNGMTAEWVQANAAYVKKLAPKAAGRRRQAVRPRSGRAVGSRRGHQRQPLLPADGGRDPGRREDRDRRRQGLPRRRVRQRFGHRRALDGRGGRPERQRWRRTGRSSRTRITTATSSTTTVSPCTTPGTATRCVSTRQP